MRTNLSSVVVVALCTGFYACGGSTSSGTQPSSNQDYGTDAGTDGPVTTPVDAGTPTPEAEAAAPVDHGSPSTTYPAFPPAFGQLMENGGYTMKNPIIVPVTWNSDASQASFDTFADEVGATSYWHTASSEYGVGTGSSGTANHVHIATAAPASVTDTNLQNMVTTNVGAATAPWPAATQDTVYAFFLPPGTSLQIQAGFGGGGGGTQDACSQGIGGYHDQITVGTVTTAYAVVPSCTFPGGNTAAQQTTMSMSHELLEAATDPQPQANNPGLVGFDNDSFAFDYFQTFQSENGDACELFLQGPDSSFYEEKETTPNPFDYWVQRTWSNKSGAAGHNPCVPVPSDPYFNVVPLDLAQVNVNLPAQLTGSNTATQQPTKGLRVLQGETKTFALGFYSDGPTSGPWTLTASAGNPLTGSGGLGNFNKSQISASLDKTSGQNGEKAYLTVTVQTPGSSFKGELVTITSSLNGVDHYRPIWIASE
jgi:hypothetical protein